MFRKISKYFFRDEKNFSKNDFFEISENFRKISKFYKDSSQKSIFEILTFVKNPYRILRFFKNFQKVQNFQKYIFFDNFFSSRKNLENFLNTYVDAKFPQESKNHT